MSKTLVDIELLYYPTRDTNKAYATKQEEDGDIIWLPKSQVEENGPI